MSKILISFLGTGALKTGTGNNAPSSSERQYRTTRYHFNNGDIKEHTFVAAALAEHSKSTDTLPKETGSSLMKTSTLKFSNTAIKPGIRPLWISRTKNSSSGPSERMLRLS